MATNFPTGLDSFTNPTGTDHLNSPDHAGQHTNKNDAIEALETKVGIDGSADTNSIDYKLSLLHHEPRVLHVSSEGTTNYLTIAEAITYLGTLSETDGYEISLSPEEHEVNSQIIIDLTMPIIIRGKSSSTSGIVPGAGLTNSDMFVVRSDVDFDNLYFSGTNTWQNGTNAAFIKYDTDGVYSEVTSFAMDTCKRGVHITQAAEVFGFNFFIENCTVAGVDVNAVGNAVGIDFEVGNFINCAVAINLVGGTATDTYLQTLRFLNSLGQTAIVYNGATFLYSNFSVLGCEWNNVGTFSTGFDWTLVRDANIEILGCVGTEDKKPHAEIDSVGNTTATVVSSSTWTKAAFTNTNSYTTKFAIANNRFTFISSHPRDMIIQATGSMTVIKNGTFTINYGIVKNGISTTIYGQQTLTCDQNSRNFTFATNVYIENASQNDYYEFWIMNATDGEDPVVTNIGLLATCL